MYGFSRGNNKWWLGVASDAGGGPGTDVRNESKNVPRRREHLRETGSAGGSFVANDNDVTALDLLPL